MVISIQRILRYVWLVVFAVCWNSTVQAQTACQVDYPISDFGSEFQVVIKINNTGSTQVSGWQLVWNVGAGEVHNGGWNADITQVGTTVTASNPAGHWNGEISPGGSVEFGFRAMNSSPPPTQVTAFTLNGVACGKPAIVERAHHLKAG